MRKHQRASGADRRAIIAGVFILLLFLGLAVFGPLLLHHNTITHREPPEAAAKTGAAPVPPSQSDETD